jgi:hypothetical protein
MNPISKNDKPSFPRLGEHLVLLGQRQQIGLFARAGMARAS